MLAYFTTILALCATATLAVRPLEIKGADFVNSVTGNRFQLVGIAYQPGGQSGYTPGVIDPLSDGAVCLRDAALMQRLGVNSIRVYNVDPNLNHDECASIFNAVGIYMLLDVNSPLSGESIDRSAPWTSYYAAYLNRTFAVVEAFKNYPNTALFFSGNEIINDEDTGTFNPPYIRAVTRDLKNYIAKNSARKIPVGYSAADVRVNLLDSWNYLQCTLTEDSSDPSRVDLFALNSYSWCGDSSFTTSGYNVLAADFAKTSVPVFFSEYGCNDPYPRIFTEVPSLYGPQMTPVMSGGLIYEYSQEPSNYGIVEVSADGSVKLLGDFDSLQRQFNTLNITALQGLTATNTTVSPPKCESKLIKTSKFNNNFTIPAVAPGIQELIDNGIDNRPVGKLVAIASTKVTQKVTASNGNAITGLEIRILADDQSNAPSGETAATSTGRPSATSAAPAATSSKASAVVNVPSTAGSLLGAVFLAFLSLLA